MRDLLLWYDGYCVRYGWVAPAVAVLVLAIIAYLLTFVIPIALWIVGLLILLVIAKALISRYHAR